VSKDFAEIKELVRAKTLKYRNSKQERTVILQKYIERPLLLNRRKFDIRCFAMLQRVNGELKGYFFEDAYIRTSCKEFTLQNVQNKFIHLTNDAI